MSSIHSVLFKKLTFGNVLSLIRLSEPLHFARRVTHHYTLRGRTGNPIRGMELMRNAVKKFKNIFITESESNPIEPCFSCIFSTFRIKQNPKHKLRYCDYYIATYQSCDMPRRISNPARVLSMHGAHLERNDYVCTALMPRCLNLISRLNNRTLKKNHACGVLFPSLERQTG